MNTILLIATALWCTSILSDASAANIAQISPVQGNPEEALESEGEAAEGKRKGRDTIQKTWKGDLSDLNKHQPGMGRYRRVTVAQISTQVGSQLCEELRKNYIKTTCDVAEQEALVENGGICDEAKDDFTRACAEILGEAGAKTLKGQITSGG